VVKDKKPLYFVAENVRGLVSMDKGEAIKHIVNDFEALGYKVNYRNFTGHKYLKEISLDHNLRLKNNKIFAALHFIIFLRLRLSKLISNIYLDLPTLT
jgi:hypothetical protein